MGNSKSIRQPKWQGTQQQLDTLLLHGYCRNNIKINIPNEILDMMFTFYHVYLETVRFPVYNAKICMLLNDDTEFKAIRVDWTPNRMISANIGYNSGYHVWKIKCVHSNFGSIQAIGVWSDYKRATSNIAWFGDANINYYWYGYNKYHIQSNIHSSIHNLDMTYEGWTSGDILTVILDCDNLKIGFEKNNEPVSEKKMYDIQPDITYYPSLVCTGHNDHYIVMSEGTIVEL
eukprot:422475_1